MGVAEGTHLEEYVVCDMRPRAHVGAEIDKQMMKLQNYYMCVSTHQYLPLCMYPFDRTYSNNKSQYLSQFFPIKLSTI